jgi:hypothetical protein
MPTVTRPMKVVKYHGDQAHVVGRTLEGLPNEARSIDGAIG